MNLIILTEQDRRSDDSFTLRDQRAEHIRSILKLKTGDSLAIGLLDGPSGTGTVTHLSADEVRITCSHMEKVPNPYPEVDLICALPRPQTLKKVLATAATMGVRRLYLIRANRVEKSYYHSPLLEPDNMNRYLTDGLSQGKLTRVPIVSVHDRFRAFFEDELDARKTEETGGSLRLLPHPEASRTIADKFESTARLLLAVGPEGGWVDFEIELMQSRGFQPVSLGPWTLRVEAAVIAAMAQVDLVFNRRPYNAST